MGIGNRGEAEREAIAQSLDQGASERDERLDADTIVRDLIEIKQLKSDCLENPDDTTLAKKLEEKTNSLKEKIEDAMDNNLDEVQDIMARGYREAAFDPIDLIEMGFDQNKKDLLSEKMSS